MEKLKTIIVISCLTLLLGCSNQDKKWEEAKSMDSIASYEDFITNYPNSPNIPIAKQNIEKLHLQNAMDCNELFYFYDFQKRYPNSSYATEVQQNIDKLESDSIIALTSIPLLKEWIEKHPQSTLKGKLDSLLIIKELPFENSMDIELEQTNTIHPKGKIYSLSLNGLKIEIIEPTLQNGFLKTKEFGDIEVVWKKTEFLDQQRIQLYVTQMQIDKINQRLKNHFQ
jgi:hypothetical protein